MTENEIRTRLETIVGEMGRADEPEGERKKAFEGACIDLATMVLSDLHMFAMAIAYRYPGFPIGGVGMSTEKSVS